jgi:hypothetical protein
LGGHFVLSLAKNFGLNTNGDVFFKISKKFFQSSKKEQENLEALFLEWRVCWMRKKTITIKI